MSKQVQFRRGSAAEHENFTGAPGEVTMDTSINTLRVHDGQTVGGTPLARRADLDAADYVIETQLPTAENNYTWYRKYKSGWVEQGGTLATGSITLGSGTTRDLAPVALPVKLQSAPVACSLENSMMFFNAHYFNGSTTSFIIKVSSQLSVPYTQVSCDINWTVFGMAAE